jgi:peptidoglycan lytic transglycosylase
MSSINCARCIDTETRIDFRKVVQLFAVALTSVALAACTQSPAVTNKSEFLGTSRQASLKGNRNATFEAHRRVSVMTKRVRLPPTDKHVASYGLASFYEEGSKTASGEKFNPNELTAAHPTLPFGTLLRVTNVSNGRSVVVRINDRGPFVPGRVVDVSHSAAETLGMTERGTAKVKLDVVQ